MGVPDTGDFGLFQDDDGTAYIIYTAHIVNYRILCNEVAYRTPCKAGSRSEIPPSVLGKTWSTAVYFKYFAHSYKVMLRAFSHSGPFNKFFFTCLKTGCYAR